jgi:hypothetical protein
VILASAHDSSQGADHYNPEKPKAWILHDDMIEGCQVVESDFDGWFARQGLR